MPDLFGPLSQDQQLLIETMAGAFLKDNQWPVWDAVQRMLRRHRLDATQVLNSLPRVGSQSLAGVSYGLVWSDRPYPADNTRPALTIAAGLHVPDFASAVARPFLLVLGTVAELERNAPISTQTVTEVRVTSADIKRAHPSVSDIFMGWLPDLMDHEPPTWASSPRTEADGGWSRDIRPQISDYEDVRDLPAYVERVVQLMPTPAQPQVYEVGTAMPPGIIFRPAQTFPLAPAAEPLPRPEYVDESLIKELEDEAGETSWHLDKLIGLIRELNSNFADEHPYACHTLLRAILDHVPPIFGAGTFEQLASNHKWPTPVDKSYMGNLSRFKTQGHDVLHRQISKKANLVRMHDVPPPLWLSTLLRHCIDTL
ncbi:MULTISPECIES: hypothetical protein [Streptacidiphilus]|uniref:Uncharacterized protein n=1 Tax=Streptacidiphilus cavernicola TaxID=3342716 RepID=A0ABV6ULT9_9ACTN|nr:hypothetical protein [Streptacidiphilus jeojiense]